MADGSLVFALEIEAIDQGHRYAPLGILDLETAEWRGAGSGLSSKTGRISGMDCRSRNGKIEAIAIERHFADRRLLRFDIEQDSVTIEAEVLLDLEDVPEMRQANPEGLLWRGDTVQVVTDNQHGKLLHGPDPAAGTHVQGQRLAQRASDQGHQVSGESLRLAPFRIRQQLLGRLIQIHSTDQLAKLTKPLIALAAECLPLLQEVTQAGVVVEPANQLRRDGEVGPFPLDPCAFLCLAVREVLE